MMWYIFVQCTFLFFQCVTTDIFAWYEQPTEGIKATPLTNNCTFLPLSECNTSNHSNATHMFWTQVFLVFDIKCWYIETICTLWWYVTTIAIIYCMMCIIFEYCIMYKWFCVYILYFQREITVVLTHFGHEYMWQSCMDGNWRYFSHILSTSLNFAVMYSELLLIARTHYTS